MEKQADGGTVTVQVVEDDNKGRSAAMAYKTSCIAPAVALVGRPARSDGRPVARFNSPANLLHRAQARPGAGGAGVAINQVGSALDGAVCGMG
jgi:hypothetical protein